MRRVFTPKWLLADLVVLAAILVMLRLGLWQWHRAESRTGGIQNYAYAFQWPLFAVFAIVLWVKTLQDEVRRPADTPRGGVAPGVHPVEADIIRQPGVRVGITTMVVDTDEEDPEVAAWNARFAALNARTADSRKR